MFVSIENETGCRKTLHIKMYRLIAIVVKRKKIDNRGFNLNDRNTLVFELMEK